MKTSVFAASYAIDWLIGDPEWLPHPVRAIGWSVDRAERAARRVGSGRRFELVAGGIVATVIPIAAMTVTCALLRRTYRWNRATGAVVEIVLGSMCIATRNLMDEAGQVLDAIEGDDILRARARLARIVGRDTASLDEPEICRAVIETLAESLCDGIIAPLFYLAIGGAPLAIAYKAVNTLDSMIGHRDERYLYFGRVAARLDDVANWVPARIGALLLCVVAAGLCLQDGPRALKTWRRDGSRHASPNAGQVEGAMAGALRVRLGGVNHYQSEQVSTPHLGGEFPAPDRKAARRAMKIVAAASILGFAAAVLLLRRGRNDG
jgi:adenosylcobinamide-phosphate synthase